MNFDFSQGIPHVFPTFTSKIYYDDIGLVELMHPVEFTKHIKPGKCTKI